MPKTTGNNSIREKNLRWLRQFNLSVTSSLPLIDENLKRCQKQIENRLFVMHAVTACAFGFDRFRGEKWLLDNNLINNLSEKEKMFISNNQKNYEIDYKFYVESLFALAWCLRIVEYFDPRVPCLNSFVKLLPDLKIGQGIDEFRAKSKLRTEHDLLAMLDLYYCLSNALVNEKLRNEKLDASFDLNRTFQRRHGLEWLFSDEKWDDVSLDT